MERLRRSIKIAATAVEILSLCIAVLCFVYSSGRVQYIGNKSVSAAKDNRTGFYYADYYKDGKTTKQLCYLDNGEIVYEFTGIMQGNYDDELYSGDEEPEKYYVENGIFNRKKTGIVKNTVHYKNISGSEWDVTKYYNVVNGMVKDDAEDIVKIGSKWYYAPKGIINYNYTGFASNKSGWWYVEKGIVTLKSNGIYKGTVKFRKNNYGVADFGWWYVKNSMVQFINSVEKNNNGWWAVFNGKVDFNYTGVAKNSSGWWYIENGKVNFKYTGFAKNDYGWWYIENGKVNFSKNDVMKGKVEGENGWWFVKNGKVQFTDSVEKNSSGWWKISNGRVDFKFTGVAKNSNGWWYCKNGKLDTSFTGIASNQNGLWYCRNGKVDFSKNGSLKYNGINYKISSSKATPLNHTHTWAKRTVSDNNGYDKTKAVYRSTDAVYFCFNCNNVLMIGYTDGETIYTKGDDMSGYCKWCGDGCEVYGTSGESILDHYDTVHIDATTHDEYYCTKCGMIKKIEYH